VKIIRSSKCSLKFATEKKKTQLLEVFGEYARVCNFFINKWWNAPPDAKKIRKVDLDCETWFCYRMKYAAVLEALSMISASKNRDGNLAIMPIHKGTSFRSTNNILFQETKTSSLFDGWLHLHSIGKKIIMDLPFKKHKQFNDLASRGRLMNSFLITPDYIQFSFEIETGAKKEEGRVIGVDTGLISLCTTSEGVQTGTHILPIIDKIRQCQYGSKHQKRLRNYLKDEISKVAKELTQQDLKLIVVEGLSKLNHKTKIKRTLGKTMRQRLGSWNYRLWLERIHKGCEDNRVAFRTVSPYYTSQQCSACGHIERSNRKSEMFKCQKCDYEDNADINAAKNILGRFLTGAFGPCATKGV
jgi:IS605 OrfB family transposase